MSKKLTIKVDGEDIVIDRKAELEIADVSRDQSMVASRMAYWASIWAAAEAEKIRVDAYYRNWRAITGQKVFEANPKMSEWKVKQEIEGSKNFMTLKNGIAEANRNAIIAKGVFESFRIKANALQSKGAMQRAELEATGMTTKRKEKERAKEEEKQEHADSMRSIFKGKKKKF